MKRLFFILCICSAAIGFISCSDDEGKSYPLPSDILNVKAIAAPGEVKLEWDLPADKNFKCVQVTYSIPELGKSFLKQVSPYTNSIVIGGLLQKYGPMEFSLQTFNEGKQGGSVLTVSAQAEKALPQIVNVKIPLNPATMYTSAPAPAATRSIAFLVDGNVADPTNFFGTIATGITLPHYIVVDLGEKVSEFYFKTYNAVRPADVNIAWKTMKLYGSDEYVVEEFFDGVNPVNGNVVDMTKANAQYIGEYMNEGAAKYVFQSDKIALEKPARWLWFAVTAVHQTATSDVKPFFLMQELEVFKYSEYIPE